MDLWQTDHLMEAIPNYYLRSITPLYIKLPEHNL